MKSQEWLPSCLHLNTINVGTGFDPNKAKLSMHTHSHPELKI